MDSLKLCSLRDWIETRVQENGEPQWVRDLRFAALDQIEKKSEKKPDFVLSKDRSDSYQKEEGPYIPKIFSELQNQHTFLGKISEGILWSSLEDACKNHPEQVRSLMENFFDGPLCLSSAWVHALWNSGTFLYVKPNQTIQLPLSVVFNAFARHKEEKVFSNHFIIVGENSQVTCVADIFCSEEVLGRVQSLTNVFLESNAKFSFLEVQRLGQKVEWHSDFEAKLESDSVLNLMTMQMGSVGVKSSWDVDMIGEGSSVHLRGVTRGLNTQQFDEDVVVRHVQPHTLSRVHFKTVLKDQSQSRFSGLTVVDQKAQGTDAYQISHHLLLGDQAKAQSIPKLEIKADDVKCGHGSTVSGLDEEQMFYLMCRGLNRKDAETILMDGFYEELLKQWDQEAGETKDRAAGLEPILSAVKQFFLEG